MRNIPNDKWIYTYDYAPDSVWEPWRGAVYPDGRGLDENGIPCWIEEEADAVAARLKEGLPARLLLADSHYVHNGTWEDTLAAMRILAKKVEISGIIHLGDLTDGLLPAEETKRITERIICDMQGVLPAGSDALYVVPGNHDYNYFRGNQELIYPDRPQYYIDDEGQKLRMIFIDSFDPKEPARYGFTDYCIHWLESVFRSMPADHKAVVFSHVPPLVRLQVWTKDIRNREKLIAVLNGYAERILAFINGHSHCDHLFNELHNGCFPVISLNCAKCEYYTDHKPEGAEVPERRLGDRTQECFDILQIDTEKQELYFTRFGAGRDRIVQNHRARYV